MPRSNRPRASRGGADDEFDPASILFSRMALQRKRDGLWNVQPISALGASKEYSCPGCNLLIRIGVAHVVAWRADGLMGEADDLASRRHWHSHCWKIT